MFHMIQAFLHRLRTRKLRFLVLKSIQMSFASLTEIRMQASGFCSFRKKRLNGDGEIRTLDPLLARQVLSQLSYAPM